MKKIAQAILLAIGLSNNFLHATKEIELKFQLTDNQAKTFSNWLELNCSEEKVQNQTEFYLDNPQKSFFAASSKGYIDALTALRVRITGEASWLCMKKRTIDPQTDRVLSTDEFETAIEDAQITLSIFETLGFTDKIIIQKIRRSFRYLYGFSSFEIVIDDVQGLGRFFEVELKDGTQNVPDGITKIKDFLKKTGLATIQQFERSYIHMLKNPGYNFSHEVTL